MPETQQIAYSLKELTEIMLRDQGIRKGLWMIWARFGFGVTNIVAGERDGLQGPAGPGVISQLLEVGLQKAPEQGPLTVDASELWKAERANKSSRKQPARRSRKA